MPPRKPSSPGLKTQGSVRVPTAVLAAIIVFAGILAFSNSFTGAFMGDDADSIVGNPHIRTLWPPRAPMDTTLAGRPVASFSFALNYALAPAGVRDALQPRNPGATAPDPSDPFLQNLWGYHALNLAIHLLAALTLFGVVRRTLKSPALTERFTAVAAPIAFAVAVIWVVHPLQTASVTYLIQRVESLMGLFYLLTIYCVIRAAETDFTDRRWIAAAIVACALGMGTKETMVTAPIVAALWIYLCWPGVRLTAQPKLLLLGLAATWVVVGALSLAPNRSMSVGFTLGGWSWWLYLRTQAEVLVHYLRLALWPSGLVFQYQWMPAASWGQVLPELILVAGLGITTLVGVIRRQAFALLGVWFFFILAPSSSILPIASEVAADHRMYLPLASVVTAIVVSVYWLASRTPGLKTRGSVAAPIAWTLVFAIVVALGVRTRARNEDYRNFEIMVLTIIEADPPNVVARIIHGSNLVRRQKFDEAEKYLRAALELPLPLGGTALPHGMTHMSLGIILGTRGSQAAAAEQFQLAIQSNPALREPHLLLAEAYLKQGRITEALAAFDAGMAAFPNAAPLLVRAAWVRATTTDDSARDGARAIVDAEKAISLAQGPDAVSLITLAAAHAETRNFESARATLDRAEAVTGLSADMRARLQAYRALFDARQPIRISSW